MSATHIGVTQALLAIYAENAAFELGMFDWKAWMIADESAFR